jgi:hypothetical protein
VLESLFFHEGNLTMPRTTTHTTTQRAGKPLPLHRQVASIERQLERLRRREDLLCRQLARAYFQLSAEARRCLIGRRVRSCNGGLSGTLQEVTADGTRCRIRRDDGAELWAKLQLVDPVAAEDRRQLGQLLQTL